MMAHTPTPWKLWPTHWAGGWGPRSALPNRIRIQQPDASGEIAYVEHHGAGTDWATRYPTDKDYANAAFIVRACNAHADLLAACEEALGLPGLCEGIGYDGDLDNVPEEMREEMLDARAWRDGIVERINAAIAKAKGG